jgi:hypothetical protein
MPIRRRYGRDSARGGVFYCGLAARAPGPVNAVEVVNEDRTVNVVNGVFTDTFQGETVHIYKFEKPTRFGD